MATFACALAPTLTVDRQQFLQVMAGLPVAASFDGVNLFPNGVQPPDRVTDEAFWATVREQFLLDEQHLDFRCHAASSLPASVVNQFVRDYTYIQAYPSARNHELAPGEKQPLRVALAHELNCSVGEVALMRSTTEALNNALMGFPFQKGDEVLASVHEYDSMLSSLYQQQTKLGITIKQIDVPYRPESAEQVVDLFKRHITPKTKLFLISHMVWISGQIYPVKELCALARQHGIYTVIDAAQSFSHIPVDVAAIDCDYLGGCLHKWAAAPVGTGFLYVKKKNIGMTMPLLGHYQYKADDEAIEKFENFGATTPVFGAATLSLAYWRNLGQSLKADRMHYLKTYWTQQLKTLPQVTLLTNTDQAQSGGLAYVQIRNKSAKAISERLMSRYALSVQAVENYKNRYVDYGDVNVIGVATPVFITPKQLDRLVAALKESIA